MTGLREAVLDTFGGMGEGEEAVLQNKEKLNTLNLSGNYTLLTLQNKGKHTRLLDNICPPHPLHVRSCAQFL